MRSYATRLFMPLAIARGSVTAVAHSVGSVVCSLVGPGAHAQGFMLSPAPQAAL